MSLRENTTIDNDTGTEVEVVENKRREIDVANKRLSEIASQYRKVGNKVAKGVVEIGKLLDEAHGLMRYRDGGWGKYCK